MTNWLPQTPEEWIPLIVALLLGWLLGWLFTRGPARRREEEYAVRVGQLESQARKTNNELDDTRNRLTTVQNNLATTEADLAAARAQNEEAKAQMTALTEQVETLGQEKENLTDALTSRGAEVADLQTQVEDHESRFVALQADSRASSDALGQDIASLQADLQDATERADALTAELEAVKQANADLRGKLDVGAAELTRMRTEYDAAGSALEEARKLAQDKDIALTEAYSTAAKLHDRLQDREAKLALLQSDYDDIRMQLVDTDNVRADLEGKLHNVRGDVAGELAMLTSTMVRMKEDALKQANARIDALTREVETLRQDR